MYRARALLVLPLCFWVGCGSSGGSTPEPLADTSPRTLDQLTDDDRRTLFDAIITCENEGLRVAAAKFPVLDDPRAELKREPQRMMRQHMVEGECKEALRIRERLTEQQVVFLRNYGMQQRWFTAHMDETPVGRAPLGEPTDVGR